LKFDFYLPELKTAVEIDGRYHFEEIHGNDLQSQIINDERKNEFVENLETIEPEKLIRIEYNSGKIDDLIKDLGDLLEKIKSEKKGTILLSDKYPKKGWNDPNNRD
jgi:very-short-patch-repair endonuclease